MRQRGLCLRGDRDELADVFLVHGAVQRVGGGNSAYQYEHDESHALLTVIAAVEKAHARAGQDQQAANPQWGRLGTLRLFVKCGDFDGRLEHAQQQEGGTEADQR